MRFTGSTVADSRWYGHHWHWAAAVLFFVVGDAVTTTAGIGVDGIVEAGPVTAPLLEAYGFLGLVGLKLAVVGGALLGWKLVPRPHCVGIPLGLTIVGFLATAWNIHIIVYILFL